MPSKKEFFIALFIAILIIGFVGKCVSDDQKQLKSLYFLAIYVAEAQVGTMQEANKVLTRGGCVPLKTDQFEKKLKQMHSWQSDLRMGKKNYDVDIYDPPHLYGVCEEIENQSCKAVNQELKELAAFCRSFGDVETYILGQLRNEEAVERQWRKFDHYQWDLNKFLYHLRRQQDE